MAESAKKLYPEVLLLFFVFFVVKKVFGKIR